MNKKWTVGRRIAAGFGVALFALAIVGGWAVFGFNGVVSNLGQAIACNVLQNEIVQREVDHLKWAKAVSDLFTDRQVTKLNVQTDPTQCAFGKWYYGEGRKEAESLVPEIRETLAAIEKPHRCLHESAIEIARHFRQADLTLNAELKQRKVDHIDWVRQVMNALLDQTKKQVDVQVDPRKCAFGQWYYSDAVRKMRKDDPELDRILAAVEEPHNKLHAGAVEINKLLADGKRAEAIQYCVKHTSSYADATCDQIDKVIALNAAKVAGLEKAQEVFAAKTSPSLKEVQGLLGQIVEKAHNAAKSRNAAISSQANTSRAGVIGLAWPAFWVH